MPTITVNNICFHYTDSGVPLSKKEYLTLFMIHGHSFHGGIFRPLFPVASMSSLRVLCIDRREYQGSTPYTREELRIIHEGTDDERLELLTLEGVGIALCIESLIRKLDLPVAGGGGLAGWSMGNVFSLAVVNALSHQDIPETVKVGLKAFIRTFIILDPPFQVLGLDSPPDDYSPLWDNDIAEADRGVAFAHWVSSYFDHDVQAISHRDPSKLNQCHPSSKRPTAERMTEEELLSVTDFLPGPKCDTAFGGFGYHTAQRLNYQNALIGTKSNSNNWDFQSVVHLYGEKSAWSMIYTVWAVEEEDGASKRIKFKAIKGANHFMMWDEPEVTVAVLKACMEGS